jgi:hypothetical protein
MRELAAGERVALESGLSLAVPADFDGWYGAGASGDSGQLDIVASHRLAQESLLHSFSAASLTPEATPLPAASQLIASSDDGAVEVSATLVHGGTPEATSLISVLVSSPGRPRGLISMMVVGEQASDEPAVVLAQAGSMWRLFKVQGAALSVAKE